MPYCPSCGKKAEDLYAKFCIGCGSDLKSLGIAVVATPSFTPKVFISKPSQPPKPPKTASEYRNARKGQPSQVEEVNPDDDGEQGVQFFDPDILGGEIEIEIDENSSGLSGPFGSSVEKMEFRLPESK